MNVTLFGTEGCHLCEQALALLKNAETPLNLSIEEVDIAHEEDLMARYGVRIPVLVNNGRELNWPFDQQDLLRFLTTPDQTDIAT